MFGPRKVTRANIGDGILKASDALGLHPLLRLKHIAILLRVPRIWRPVVAEKIVGKQKLNIATTTGANRRSQQTGALADLRQQISRNDFDLDRPGTRGLELLDLLADLDRFVDGLAHGAQAAGPGALARQQAGVALDWNPHFRRSYDKARRPLTHDVVGDQLHRLVTPFESRKSFTV